MDVTGQPIAFFVQVGALLSARFIALQGLIDFYTAGTVSEY